MPQDPYRSLKRLLQTSNSSSDNASSLRQDAVGNQTRAALASREGSQERQAMLAFIQQRLEVVETTQAREAALCGPRAQRDWWRKVADSYADKTTKPEPTRWCEAGRLYGRAADAAARGDLPLAAGLLRAAVREEQEAFRSLTDLVDTRDLQQRSENPWHTRVTSQRLEPITVPSDIRRLAHSVANHNTHIADPPVKRVVRQQSATELDNEEEEEDHDA